MSIVYTCYNIVYEKMTNQLYIDRYQYFLNMKL